MPFNEMWNSALIKQLLNISLVFLLLLPVRGFAQQLGESDAYLRISNDALNRQFKARTHHLDAVDLAGAVLAVSPPNVQGRQMIPPLGADVDIWLGDLGHGADPVSLRRVLAPYEIARAERFVQEIHRSRFILRRAFRRIVLGHYLDRAPADLVFDEDGTKKPVLKGPRMAPRCISARAIRGISG